MNSKRKRDDIEGDVKKTKNEDVVSSNEWPMYAHPDGGLVKITPWGSLRQYTDPITGELISKFEDTSFHEHQFNMANMNAEVDDMSIDPTSSQVMPPTPQSIQQCQLLTPSNNYSDAESYVLNGYEGFNQEHENYFGME